MRVNYIYMYSTIQIEVRENIAIIKLNRPDKLNAINFQMVDELVDALNKLDSDDKIKVVIITGNGKAFSAGADVKEMLETPLEEIMKKGHMPLWEKLRTFKKPVIAALNGITAGGGLELAMACDIIIASESAKLGQPEINLGIMPGAGGTQRLTRILGKYKAMELVLTGKLIDSEEAERYGLVNKVVPDNALIDEVIRLAKEIAEKPMISLMLAKEAVAKAWDTLLQQGLDFERRNFYLALSSEEAKEGMRAFLEKRKPRWENDKS
ncbi:enoyl-CoA hydratase/isomerase family protein [Saccharolobus shibatae]|uniref:Enoyl-CoA hydratase n=1 Tax=Saccharolobus shibatae TaxID=2286 RepID=A0A8F5BZS4_9CREN|nr:enoyl-CoA hydratase-related protein [Saccharolobus shibatae]QXJ31322.1 Enoyl-CoA hydratase [Saccharolobus shibatae]QXJ34340.1 Enoyl-CoA hydratase [Saccharolobus shibatae]